MCIKYINLETLLSLARVVITFTVSPSQLGKNKKEVIIMDKAAFIQVLIIILAFTLLASQIKG